jgi:hypothetical protein
MLNKKQLIDAVELAWAAASEAKISPNTIMLENGTMDSIRWNTYLCLLGAIVPRQVNSDTKVAGDMVIQEPREKWQASDD